MLLNIVLIVVGLVVVLFLAIFLFATYLHLKSKRLAKRWLATHPQTPLSEEQERLLTFGAILARYRSEKVLSLVLDSDPKVYAKGLEDQWGVSDRPTAWHTLTDLLELKRSQLFDAQIERAGEDGEYTAIHDDVSQSIAQALNLDVAQVKAVKSTYAWDVCRLVSLAKWCYQLDYITLDEMWSFMERGAQKASRLGVDWQEYTISFLLGRAMQGFGLDVSDLCQELLQGGADNVYQRYSFK